LGYHDQCQLCCALRASSSGFIPRIINRRISTRTKQAAWARIALTIPVIVLSYEGMSERDVIRAARIVEANVALLRREWRRIHG
jgi:hypothetical protein